MQAGDCLHVGGPPDRPQVDRAQCGGSDANFRIVSVLTGDGQQCPIDVDSYYAWNSPFSGHNSTICMDVDWVVGGCMSVDPDNSRDPLRVDCTDGTVAHRQRAVAVLPGIANVDQCDSGIGYAYDERQFTVCVEDVS